MSQNKVVRLRFHDAPMPLYFDHKAITRDQAENKKTIGTLDPPGPNARYELEENEDGSIAVVLVTSDKTAGEASSNTVDHQPAVQPQTITANKLASMNVANRAFYSRK